MRSGAEMLPPDLYKCRGSPVRVVRSVPEEQHADQDKCRGNGIPNKVHPMDALTATKPVVLVLDIKTIPTLCHLANQPRRKCVKRNPTVAYPVVDHRSFTFRTVCQTRFDKLCRMRRNDGRIRSIKTPFTFLPPKVSYKSLTT